MLFTPYISYSSPTICLLCLIWKSIHIQSIGVVGAAVTTGLVLTADKKYYVTDQTKTSPSCANCRDKQQSLQHSKMAPGIDSASGVHETGTTVGS